MTSIEYEINPEGTIGILRVNRPEVRNALDFKAQEKFATVIKYFSDQSNLRVLLITGSGKAFISGADLRELQQQENESQRLSRVMGDALDHLETMEAISIAVINGPARGGGAEVAVACDLRVMAQDATIAFVHAKLGLIPGWGGGERLFRLLGESRALELIATARVLSSQEAFQMALVNHVYPTTELMHESIKIANKIIDNQSQSTLTIKKLFQKYRKMNAYEARLLEREKFNELWDTEIRRKIFDDLGKEKS